MGERMRDALFGVVLGGLVGALPGLLAAGAFVTWRLGGDLREIDLMTYPRLVPVLAGQGSDLLGRGALVGLGVLVACALGGIALSWRQELTSHGRARWASRAELRGAGLLARRPTVRELRGPIWGKLGGPRSRQPYLSSDQIVHSLVAAPTGSGKGVGVVIPTLLTYPGSTVVLDVKGENYAKTARRRHQLGDRVFRFAPYADDRRGHRYNPVDAVAAAPERRRYAEAVRLGGSLLVEKPGAEGWINGAREIFAATLVTAIERGEPTLAAVYDLLSMPGAPNEILATLAAGTESGEAVSVFNRFAGMPEKSLGGYVSIMFEAGLRLWANPDVRDATAASDFTIASFRSDPASVFLCVSQKDLDVLAPLIRLLFQQMFTELQEVERTGKDKFDVLFLLDEFASLGRMDELGRAITTVRSSGAHLMLIVQSLANLQVYGRDGASNFMGNCQLQLFMAPTDMETPRYISEAIGQRTYAARTKSWRQTGFGPASISERHEGAALIRPEEVRLLGAEAAIALVRDQNPIAVRKVRWFADRRLKKLHDAQAAISFDAFAPGEMPRAPRSGEIFELVAPKAATEQGAPSAERAPGSPEQATTLSPEASSPETSALSSGEAPASSELDEGGAAEAKEPSGGAVAPPPSPGEASAPESSRRKRIAPAAARKAPDLELAADAPAPAGFVKLRDRSRDLAGSIRRYQAGVERGRAADGGG